MKLFSFFFIVVFVLNQDLKKMRSFFHTINKSETAVEQLKTLSLSTNEVSNSLKMAYYAAAEMTSAQYKISPVSKINAFNSGKKILEKVVLIDSLNAEIRYIRFTIQTNAPGFLGYNKNIKSDKQFLIKKLNEIKQTDTELYSNIYAYLQVHGKLSEQEKKLING